MKQSFSLDDEVPKGSYQCVYRKQLQYEIQI